MPLDGMDRFEQKEMKKKTSIKNTWYDWLINCIAHIVKTVGGFKDKVVSFFKNLSKQTVVHGNKPSKLKIQKESEEDNIIKNIRNLFRLNKILEQLKIEYLETFWVKLLFEQEDDYNNAIRVGNVRNKNFLEYESNSDENKNLSLKKYL